MSRRNDISSMHTPFLSPSILLRLCVTSYTIEVGACIMRRLPTAHRRTCDFLWNASGFAVVGLVRDEMPYFLRVGFT